ncbi:MAG: hypothetical protein ACLUIQ_03545 [Dialister invisus]
MMRGARQRWYPLSFCGERITMTLRDGWEIYGWKEENGIWARYWAGRTNWIKERQLQTDLQHSPGRLRQKKKLDIGAALDYGTGKDTYANGTGKEKLASLALYGAAQKETDST